MKNAISQSCIRMMEVQMITEDLHVEGTQIPTKRKLLMWETSLGKYYTCADITMMTEELRQCEGKCLNDGVCVNGMCICYGAFTGDFCEIKSIKLYISFL